MTIISVFHYVNLYIVYLEAIKLLHGLGLDIVTHVDVRLHSLVVTVG